MIDSSISKGLNSLENSNSFKSIIESEEIEKNGKIEKKKFKKKNDLILENHCNGHGRIDLFNKCLCDHGFTGKNCEIGNV